MTVGRLEAEVTGVELLEWMAYLKIEKEQEEEVRLAAKANEGAARAKARPR